MNAKGIKHATTVLTGLFTKNSPSILTGLGVAGVLATTVFAVKATPKALLILDEEKYNREKVCTNNDKNGPDELIYEGPPISVKDAIALTWKCYIPATIMGTVTIFCIIGANKINLRRNAALAGLYSLSETALKEYQSKVVETIGKNKEQKIKDDIAKDIIDKNPVSTKEIIFTGQGETLCYDSLSGRYFKSDIEKIRKVSNELSRQLLSDTSVSLNEVYDALGLKSTKMGDLVCFHIDDGLIEPEFSATLTDEGAPCLVMGFVTEPRYLYDD